MSKQSYFFPSFFFRGFACNKNIEEAQTLIGKFRKGANRIGKKQSTVSQKSGEQVEEREPKTQGKFHIIFIPNFVKLSIRLHSKFTVKNFLIFLRKTDLFVQID